jgi:histidinol-phosphate aminotransferase
MENSQQFINPNVQRMSGYVPGHQPPPDSELIKLNTNENAFPLPLGKEFFSSLSELKAERYPDPVCRASREGLGRRFGLPAEHLILGNGSDEILTLIFRACSGPNLGNTVWSWDPTYSLYPVLANIQSSNYQEVGLLPDFSPDWEGLLARAAAGDVILLPNPHAPTGRTEPAAELLARVQGRRDLLWVIDEAYGDFASESMLPNVKEDNPNLIVTRSFSKSFSAAGLRLGFAAAVNPLMEAMYKIKDSYNVNMLTQRCAEALMEDGPWQQIQDNVQSICTIRQWTSGQLRERGFECPDSGANFVFARPGKGSASDLFHKLEEQKVVVRHFPKNPRTADWLRITIADRTTMEEFFRRLDLALS